MIRLERVKVAQSFVDRVLTTGSRRTLLSEGITTYKHFLICYVYLLWFGATGCHCHAYCAG